MNNPQSGISSQEAHLLMSALLDGEIEATDAARLNDYLRKNPQDLDWMESQSILRESINGETSQTKDNESIQAILKQLPPKEALSNSKLLKFPKFLAPLAAAAAVVLVTTLAWKEDTQAPTDALPTTGSNVEFVSTDIPNANPIIFTDEESGWTVVWVATMDPIPEEA